MFVHAWKTIEEEKALSVSRCIYFWKIKALEKYFERYKRIPKGIAWYLCRSPATDNQPFSTFLIDSQKYVEK